MCSLCTNLYERSTIRWMSFSSGGWPDSKGDSQYQRVPMHTIPSGMKDEPASASSLPNQDYFSLFDSKVFSAAVPDRTGSPQLDMDTGAVLNEYFTGKFEDSEAAVSVDFRPQRPKIPVPCRYFSEGKCRMGPNCRFLHESPQESQRICKFFAAGYCKYGDKCTFRHPPSLAASQNEYSRSAPTGPPMNDYIPEEGEEKTELCEFCERAVLPIDDPEQCRAHIEQCKERSEQQNDRAYSVELVCSNCGENVLGINERFGVMQMCNHVFCLPCARARRSNTNGGTTGSMSRKCPVCGIPSDYIIPSPIFPRNLERKQTLLLQHKRKLAQIPCKFFDMGRGTCPFGESCFYAHVDEHGHCLNRPGGNEDLGRWYVGAQGVVQEQTVVSLSDFLVYGDDEGFEE